MEENNVNEAMDKQAVVNNLWDAFRKKIYEIQKLYFANERHFDKFDYSMYLGFDNVTYEPWFDFEEYRSAYQFCNVVMWIAECKGYGPGAASRGFDVTKPEGLMWTIAFSSRQILDKIADINGYKTSTWLSEDVKWLHECSKRHADWKKQNGY